MEKNKDYVSYRILLKPTEEQKKLFNEYFGLSRFIYNLGINLVEDHYNKSKNDDTIKRKFLRYIDTQKIIVEMEKTVEYNWISKYDTYTFKQVLIDLDNAYKKWFDGVTSNKPKYHTKKYSKMSFPTRSDRMRIYKDKVVLSTIKEISVEGSIPDNVIGYSNKDLKNTDGLTTYIKYSDARIIFDGCKYYLHFTIKKDETHQPLSCNRYKLNEVWQHKPYSDVIGMDMGCGLKNWLVMSNGDVIERPSQKKEEKRIAGYQQKFARQHKALLKDLEKRGIDTATAKQHYSKSIIKTLEKQNKIEKKITNRKKNAAREAANQIVKIKPRALVIEDAKFKDWMVDKKKSNLPNIAIHGINKSVRDAMLYETRETIVNMCEANDIPVIYADKEYPSTQLCSNCGNLMDMPLTKKTYKCNCCGLVMNRDLNASINLKHYGENLMNEFDDLDMEIA